MSDIDNDNLTGLPEGWSFCKINNIGEILTGNTPSKDVIEYWNTNDIPFVKPPDFEISKQITFTKEYITIKAKSIARLLPINSILVTCIGKIGKVAINNIEVAFNQQINAIIPNNKIINYKYLFHLMQSNEINEKLNDNSSATTLSILNKTRFSEISINIPPINEQKRIVTKIDEVLSQVNEIKEKLQHSKKLVDSFKKSVLTKAFKGELVPTEAELARREGRDYETASQLLAKINQSDAKTKNKSNIPPTDTEPSPDLPEGWIISTFGDNSFFVLNPKKSEINTLSDDEEITFVPMPSVSDIKGCILNPSKIKLGEVRKGYTYFRESDVLFAKITPCMENGKSAIALNLINGIGFGSTEFHVIRSKGYVLPNWIHLFVRREEFRGEAKDHMTGNVGQQRVPIRFIEETKIPIPPKEEQKRIVAKIDELYKLADEINDQIDKALVKVDNITQAVLRKAFKGELVPTEAELARREGRDYEPASVLLEKIKSQTRESSEKPKIQKKSKQER